MMKEFDLLLERLAKSVDLLTHKSIYTLNPQLDYSQLYVVFEFECYLQVDKNIEDSTPSGGVDMVSGSNYWSVLQNYFSYSERAFRRAYESWVNEQIESIQEDLDDDEENSITPPWRMNKSEIQDYIDEHGLDESEFLSDYFGSFEEILEQFNAEPYYGWTDGDQDYFYLEEPESMDPDDIRISAYHQLIGHSFFEDKQVNILKNYHSGIKKPDTWYVEPDSSVTDNEPNEYVVGVEIVSAWIPGDLALQTLREFKEFYDDFDGMTDEHTGFHINIRYANHQKDLNPDDFNWIKLVLLSQDETELYRFGRETNEYAEPITYHMKKALKLKEIPQELKPENLSVFETALRRSMDFKKYHSINFTKFFNDSLDGVKTDKIGFIEFRGPGNDYLDNRYAMSEKSLIKFMNIMLLFDSPKYQKEYHVRLLKLYRSLFSSSVDRTEQETLEHSLYYLQKNTTIIQLFHELIHYSKVFKTISDPSSRPIIFPKSSHLRKYFSNVSHKYLSSYIEEKDNNIWLLAILHRMIVTPEKFKRPNETLEKLKQLKEFSLMGTFIRLKQSLKLDDDHIPRFILDSIMEGHDSFHVGDIEVTAQTPITAYKKVLFGNLTIKHKGALSEIKNLPETVRGNFSILGNQLTSLEGAPQTVGGAFDCSNNRLSSLEGAPRSVGGNFSCSFNELPSLAGAPRSVGGNFVCRNNQLTSLEGAPRSVGGNFVCIQQENHRFTEAEVRAVCNVKGNIYV